eukprot:CAMPEP_0206255438 /NCGR_PEP_ID=MMETSP0047_2-20121206/24246_1 /ASSEMBLY_ACC=CAM_ASM_000192 /TAXON_ID=195065 /ORGANISM="Chroomonas mesostigmatica_cf, Strain CCMP1168" /LENGTH=552 /DNA_ID=CAMNT_0053681835 /DNA_START=1 /DNA_END=1659 /DNA_ORIENTATION=-
MLWMRASSCVARALNVGTNPVIVSLVQGDTEKLCEAMNCASRGERFDWLTRVDVNGEVLSPLFWSIRDGNFSIAKFIINDLLTIRADREAYYYGMSKLFETHPDVVEILCRECPSLLESCLFDGLMWHSRDVEAGFVRVNYYIVEMYGVPEKEPNVWRTPLAILVKAGRNEVFNHPVGAKLLQVKWDRFGKRCFLGVQGFYAIMLILFMVGNIEYHDDCRFKGLRYFLGAVALIAGGMQAFIAVRQRRCGWTDSAKIKMSPFRVNLPNWLRSPWNMLRFIACWLLVIACFMEQCRHWGDEQEYHGPKEYNRVEYVSMSINAFVGVLLWSQELQILVLSTRLAALTYNIGYMFEDVGRNLVVVTGFVFAFATALTALQSEHFETFGGSVTVLVRVTLGIDPPSMIKLDSLALFFLFLFVICVTIGMLNILIAQLWSSFGHVAANKKVYAMQHRADICIHMESILPFKTRKRLFDEMHFDLPVPFSQGDAGPPGGIQMMEPASVRNGRFYMPDRILRFTGEASPQDPWPALSKDVLLQEQGGLITSEVVESDAG